MAETHPAGAARRSRQDQLAVASLHERLVGQALDRLHVPATVVDRSAELGLTLLELPHDAVRAHALGQPGRGGEQFPLDAVLSALYEQFATAYGGWVPTMGKNRALARVTHNIGGGDEGAPSPAARPEGARRSGPSRPAAVIGIADTRLYPHPDLGGAYVAAFDSMLVHVAPGTDYAAGHATFIAGAALQEAPGARLEVLEVLGENGQADSWDVAKGLVRLGAAGVDVLNMSFGCFTEDNRPPLVLATAIDRVDASAVLVAAAGNHASPSSPDRSRPLWPAALDDVVAVGATDDEGARPEWSQPPAEAPWIDVLAGGVELVSTYLPGRLPAPPGVAGARAREVGPFEHAYARWSGTSFAAARVSGATAARIVRGQVDGQRALTELLQELPRTDGLPWLR